MLLTWQSLSGIYRGLHEPLNSQLQKRLLPLHVLLNENVTLKAVS